VAEILQLIERINLEFVLSPTENLSEIDHSKNQDFNKLRTTPRNIHELVRLLSKRFRIMEIFSIVTQSFFMRPQTKIKIIDKNRSREILKRLDVKQIRQNASISLSYLQLNYRARFLRPKILGRFKIKEPNLDFYIQQHIDPIKIEKNTKHIVRLHDLLPLTQPELFTGAARQAFKRGFFRLLSDKEIIWVMDTEASKDEFKQIFGAYRKVVAIPCQVGNSFNIEDAILSINNKKSFGDIYLCVNTVEPRKNIELVVLSFLESLQMNDSTSRDELYIVGKYGWMQKDLIEKLRCGFFGKQVKFLENATESELEGLYKKAHFIISASKAEGFGLPPLEGMLFGCLPLVSNIPQHLETMGNQATYFELNQRSITEAISKSKKISDTERIKLGIEAHNYVSNNFGTERLAKMWLKLLDSSLHDEKHYRK
jgi:glycosyltransferase involved in cell wall biosynthesis